MLELWLSVFGYWSGPLLATSAPVAAITACQGHSCGWMKWSAAAADVLM